MSNLSEQTRLVEMETITAVTFFARTLQADLHYSQIVYNSKRQRLGEVGPTPSRGQRVKVYQGDVVVRIYHVPRKFELVGTIATADHYKRMYSLSLELMVNDTRQVAEAYIWGGDPVGEAISRIKAAFEQQASQWVHNRIPGFLPLNGWLAASTKGTGIYVEQVAETMFREDPRYTFQEQARVMEKQKQELEKLRKQQEEAEREIELQQLLWEKKLERQKKTMDHLYEICYKLRQTVADEIEIALKERIHDGFERGRSPSELSSELFALLKIFEDHPQFHMEENVMKATYNEVHSPNGDGIVQQSSGQADTQGM